LLGFFLCGCIEKPWRHGYNGYGILKTIEDNEKSGYINSYDSYVLAGLVKKLYNHLYGNIQEFENERVSSMLDDMLLVEYEEEILNAVSEKAVEIASNFLAMGVSPEDVAKATALPLEKIKKLQLQLIPA